MFEGTVERISHEGGLMVPFTGASPALGSILVDEGGAYVGKVDAVLGTTDAPVVHLAHLDRKRDPESLIGATLAIRARADRQGGRGGDERRGGRFDRGNDRRGGDRDQRGGGDWTCPQCSNSNFSFRTECNRCSAPGATRPETEVAIRGAAVTIDVVDASTVATTAGAATAVDASTVATTAGAATATSAVAATGPAPSAATATSRSERNATDAALPGATRPETEVAIRARP